MLFQIQHSYIFLPTWNQISFPNNNEWGQTGLKNRATITPMLTVVIHATNISAPEEGWKKDPNSKTLVPRLDMNTEQNITGNMFYKLALGECKSKILPV